MSENIYSKLFNVQSSCNALKRDTKGGTGKFSFKYASLAEVQGEVNKYLAENKVLLNFEFFNAELVGDLIKVECRAKFINIENIEEVVLVIFPFLIDHNKSLNIVQCIGAAQTYARRYFLQNYFNLVTKEALDQDPDQYQKSPRAENVGNKEEQSPTNNSASKKIKTEIYIKDQIDSYFKNDQLKFQWFNILKESPNFVENGYKWGKYSQSELQTMIGKMTEFQRINSSEDSPTSEDSVLKENITGDAVVQREIKTENNETFESDDDDDEINWD